MVALGGFRWLSIEISEPSRASLMLQVLRWYGVPQGQIENTSDPSMSVCRSKGFNVFSIPTSV